MSEKLIDAGMDRISISIEGIDPKEFEQNRIGAKFNTIEELAILFSETFAIRVDAGFSLRSLVFRKLKFAATNESFE